MAGCAARGPSVGLLVSRLVSDITGCRVRGVPKLCKPTGEWGWIPEWLADGSKVFQS